MTLSYVLQTGTAQERFAAQTLCAITFGSVLSGDCGHGFALNPTTQQQPGKNYRYHHTFSIANKELREPLQD